MNRNIFLHRYTVLATKRFSHLLASEDGQGDVIFR